MTTKIRWPREKPIIECDEIPHSVVTLASCMAVIMVFTWGYFHYLHRDIVQVFVAVQDPTGPTFKEEFEKHWGETPTESFEVAGGKLLNHWGNTDNCVSVERNNPDGPNQVLAFVLDDGNQTETVASLFASPALAAGPGSLQDRCRGASCGDPRRCPKNGNHPGYFEYEPESINECEMWVYYTFADCCQYRQLVDNCYGLRGPIEWGCCRH